MASQQSPPKRPRLSLQTKTSPATRSSRSFPIDPTDLTAFNTLSNVYVTAIERSSNHTQSEPITAINTLQAFSLSSPVDYKDSKYRVVTPYVANYPETPVTATSTTPPQLEIHFPSTMTATPPLSAGPIDANASDVFSFSAAATAPSTQPTSTSTPVESRRLRGRMVLSNATGLGLQAPYTHPRALHSILRNSPLPPGTAISPSSPRRQSLRLLEKAAKRVEYNNPLTQDIITNKYIKTHVDLLLEEASPNSPAASPQAQDALDLALAFTANELQDGGQTPGPFEDMRRRMAGLVSETPVSPGGPAGVRKRKRKEKKRRWVWTIEADEEDQGAVDNGAENSLILAPVAPAKSEDNMVTPMTAIPQINCPETPTPSIESVDWDSQIPDVAMPDVGSLSVPTSRGVTPSDSELDMKTPTAPQQPGYPQRTPQQKQRDTPIPELGANRDTPIPELSVNRDTPVPPELIMSQRDTPIPPELG